MSEKTELAEKKPVAVQEKPKKIWDGALKMVRGESTALEEERRAHDRDLTELRNRLAALEKQAANKPAVAGKEKNRKGTIIRDLTVLIAIAAGAWIIVTVINKFF